MSPQPIPAHLDAFKKMLGTWSGTLIRLGPDGTRRSAATIDVEARFAQNRWCQTNTLTEADGSIHRVEVTARFDESGIFRLDTPSVIGTGGQIGANVVVTWSSKANPRLTFAELITFHGPASRTRSWHHFDDGALAGFTLLCERRAD